jgi:multidrug efflux pump
MQILNPAYLMGTAGADGGAVPFVIGFIVFLTGAFASSITVDAIMLERRQRQVKAGRTLSPFGWFIKLIAGNPIMPLVSIAAVVGFVITIVFVVFPANSKGVEFFVESEPEMALVYVLAKGNLSLQQQDNLVKQAEDIVLAHPGIKTAFAFAGDGGLNNNTGGAQPPKDTIGQIQMETIPWEDRPDSKEPWFTIPLVGITVDRAIKAADFDGDLIIEELTAQLKSIPGAKIEILAADRSRQIFFQAVAYRLLSLRL